MSTQEGILPNGVPYAFARLVGFSVTRWSPDFARVELEIDDRLGNRFGIPHGGIHATLLDTAMGYAGVFTADPARQRMSMTLSLTTHFLSQPRGTRLIAEGRRTGGGQSTYFAEGIVTDETGERIATGTGVFRYRKQAGAAG